MGTLIRRDNGIYYGVFAHRGKRVWRSTKTRDADDARRIFEIVEKEFQTWERLTISGLKCEMLRLLEGKLAPTTLKLYAEAFSSFVRIVGERSVRSVTPYHVELYLSKRISEVSAAKVNIDYGSLKAAFNRAVTYRMVNSNPFQGIKKVRIPEQTPQFLTREEFERLLHTIDDTRFRSLVIVAVCTAMRLSELLNLRWQDIDLDRGIIYLKNRHGFRTKSRRNREIPLNQKARGMLASLPRGSQYIFPGPLGKPLMPSSATHRFKRYVRLARLPEWVHFHSIRHTGASWLVQSNVPLAYVKEILGHSSVTTTMIYSHNTTDHLRESLLRLDSYLGN